ncbi:MAG: SMP-30/gluconolactonase/LRE family protein, partial [Planctomycetaceae bacterium]|nr:SMP-30/gluconolactonase/LRE family protein [Planctomycetaceae bacterium]
MGFNGAYEGNDRLSGIELILVPGGHGPESFALGPDGMLYTGLKGGRIIRFQPDGSGMEDFSNTNGRANGMRFDADGNLIIVDSYKGLLSSDSFGSVTTLTTASGGQSFVFNDGVDISADRIIWFADATARHADGRIHLELLEARSTGRVLAYDPTSGEARTVLDNLRFPNGVALGPNDAYSPTNETLGYRTLRHWLKGPKAG